ncbi:MAG TPA: hybrid sensor histidine kinase/response regulator [Xanthomonadaceae bacterium]|nr:hybrid sensor histidine kinase/response regulator [Xanthomonadaceae bacterium]
MNCLIVDDLQENLLATSALLRSDDVHILQAASGPEALELLLANDDIALALLDVQMPGMDGFELAELMRGRERTRDIPIIFLTAGTHDRRRVFKGYERGAVDFIHKPVDVHVLKAKAEVFFQLHRQKTMIAEELSHRTEALRLNEMFVAVLAHDLRNPLATILTAADLLKSHQGDEQLTRIAQGILSSGWRMSRMINDLLDLVRARLAGGILLLREPCDLGEIVGAVVLEQQTARPHRRIEVRQKGDLSGVWDRGRLAQVASNLIGNALQHGDPGAPVVVCLDGDAASRVMLSVANRGVIPVENRIHLFDPFRSGMVSANSAAGLGLGLYIAQQIAQAHGGNVMLDSSVTDETRFSMTLPRDCGA